MAIRNRIYTDETRLRGLEILIFLVHEGGLCLCSREFHSPGFINIIKKKSHLHRRNPPSRARNPYFFSPRRWTLFV